MKTLIFNGSPRKSGDTVYLIAEMQKYLAGEVKIISSYYDKINPCVDCRYCWENIGCCIDDGMREVYGYIKEYDNIVIASPVYFSELTGSLLNMMSRLQCFFAAGFFMNKPVEQKSKNGVLILTGGGDGSHTKAESTANTLFKFMNTKKIAEIYSLNTNNIPAQEDGQALQGARNAAVLLNNSGNFL
jgi:multimeric flavodoxin WrbA